MNLRLVSGAGPVVASGPNGTVTLDDLAAMALSGHSLTAIELRDAVVQRLRDTGSASVGSDAGPDAGPDAVVQRLRDAGHVGSDEAGGAGDEHAWQGGRV